MALLGLPSLGMKRVVDVASFLVEYRLDSVLLSSLIFCLIALFVFLHHSITQRFYFLKLWQNSAKTHDAFIFVYYSIPLCSPVKPITLLKLTSNYAQKFFCTQRQSISFSIVDRNSG